MTQISEELQIAPLDGAGQRNGLLFTAACYVVQALLVVWILRVELVLPARNLAIPITYRGDAVYFLMIVKAIVREGWWWHVHSLSAPFGADLAGMPLLGDFDGALVKIISLFTNKSGLVLNLAWLTTIVLAGASSTWSMLQLGIQRWVAFGLGILYALSPHVFYRSESHMMLTHQLIPPVVALAILLCAGQTGDLRGKRLGMLLAGCFLMGLGYVYFAFFSAFILLVGGVTGYLRTRDPRILVVSTTATAVLVVTFGMAMLPAELTWNSDPAMHRFITFKSPAEADIYGLKIRQLLDPTARNPIPFLAKLAAKDEAANFPFENNESGLARLGTVGSLGLLSVLVVAVLFTTTQTSRWMALLKAIGVLDLACILLGTVGGFGSIFNLLVVPDVRCYNRISIFIACLSITAFGVVLTEFLTKATVFLRKLIATWNGSNAAADFGLKAVGAIFLGLLVFFGVADQNQAYMLNSTKADDEMRFRNLSVFVKQIEDRLPQDAMVYQMPDVPYFEGPHPLNRMFSNDHAQIFALSNHVRWSWPATSAEAVSFGETLGKLEVPEMVDKLRRTGFQGIYIDRYGYPDNAVVLLQRLVSYLGSPALESANGRYAFVALVNTPKDTRLAWQEYDWGKPILFTNGGNAWSYMGIGWGPDFGTSGKQATMHFKLASPAKNVLIRARVTPSLFANITVRPVKIFVNDTWVGEWQVDKPAWYSVTVPSKVVENQGGLSIRFELPNAASPRSMGVNGDDRVLSVHFEEMDLSLSQDPKRA